MCDDFALDIFSIHHYKIITSSKPINDIDVHFMLMIVFVELKSILISESFRHMQNAQNVILEIT